MGLRIETLLQFPRIAAAVKDGLDPDDFPLYVVVNRKGETFGEKSIAAEYFLVDAGKSYEGIDVGKEAIEEVIA